MAGARWVQNEILAQEPGRSLRVYAVWFNVMPGDDRSEWREGLLGDPRVVHLWDEERKIGRYFGAHPDFRGRGLVAREVMWDTYLLFDTQSRWAETPSDLVGAGHTIVAAREQLRRDLLSVTAVR